MRRLRSLGDLQPSGVVVRGGGVSLGRVVCYDVERRARALERHSRLVMCTASLSLSFLLYACGCLVLGVVQMQRRVPGLASGDLIWSGARGRAGAGPLLTAGPMLLGRGAQHRSAHHRHLQLAPRPRHITGHCVSHAPGSHVSPAFSTPARTPGSLSLAPPNGPTNLAHVHRGAHRPRRGDHQRPSHALAAATTGAVGRRRAAGPGAGD